jgi:hypothetical protein
MEEQQLPEEITVQGAGEQGIDGVYRLIGTYKKAKPHWQKPNTRLYIRWRGGETTDF